MLPGEWSRGEVSIHFLFRILEEEEEEDEQQQKTQKEDNEDAEAEATAAVAAAAELTAAAQTPEMEEVGPGSPDSIFQPA